MPKIRVAVVNDQTAVNELWRQMLDMTDDMECVGTARSGLEAVELTDAAKPDIVVMDVMMPGMDGHEATRIIRERHPNTQVVVYSAYNGMEQGAYEAGAAAYLLMPIGPDKLRETIRQVYRAHHKST
jgi:DNA-binding NarL/FixJ family response regulator